MKKISRLAFLISVATVFATSVFAQEAQTRQQRRPAASAVASPPSTPAPSGQYFSILDGTPVLPELHHDTEVGTGKPIDVWAFVIELQVMNSDGNLEPEGLQIFNFYTAYPQDRKDDVNPRNARDCKIWYARQTKALQERNPKLRTWPYVEFVTSTDARVLQTNEDGAVWYSDDIQCWGASDRFSPF